jgi:hypothetical protein
MRLGLATFVGLLVSQKPGEHIYRRRSTFRREIPLIAALRFLPAAVQLSKKRRGLTTLAANQKVFIKSFIIVQTLLPIHLSRTRSTHSTLRSAQTFAPYSFPPFDPSTATFSFYFATAVASTIAFAYTLL